MDVHIEVDKSDKRLRSIQADIQRLFNEDKRVSCISDEEIRAYVKKYFMFNTIMNQDLHRREDDDSQDPAPANNKRELKPRMYDEVD